MNLYICRKEDVGTLVMFEKTEPEMVCVRVDVPKKSEEVINGFLKIENCMEGDSGVSIEILLAEVFNLGLNWPK